MNKFNKILADHDDVKSHGTIVYSTTSDPDHVYADVGCTAPVSGETLKDIYLKGCVVATVVDGVITNYTKPTGFDGTKLVMSAGSGNGGNSVGGIVDVAELPTENINDNAIYRVETSTVGCEDIYVFTDGLDAPVTIPDMFKVVDPSLEAIVKIHTVDELPGELLPMDAATYTMHIYVVRDTGIGYINATYEGNDEAPSRAPMSVYMDDYANLSRGPDKGWIDSVEDITEYGVYALRCNVVDYTYYIHKNGIWTLLVGVNTTTKTLPNDFWEAFEAGVTIGGEY